MARLFLGNLPHSTTETELQWWLEQQGFRVDAVQVIRDLESGEGRGFGFAELPEVTGAKEVLRKLKGQRMEGHALRVSDARPVNLNRNEQSGAPKRKAS